MPKEFKCYNNDVGWDGVEVMVKRGKGRGVESAREKLSND